MAAPLLKAVAKQQVKLTRLLVEGGADLFVTNDDKETALMLTVTSTASLSAGESRRTFILEYLLTHGARPSVNAQDKLGRTALIHVCLCPDDPDGDQANLAQVLLENGADPNMKDCFGHDCISYATRNGKTEVLAVLARTLGKKAELGLASRRGKSGKKDKNARESQENRSHWLSRPARESLLLKQRSLDIPDEATSSGSVFPVVSASQALLGNEGHAERNQATDCGALRKRSSAASETTVHALRGGRSASMLTRQGSGAQLLDDLSRWTTPEEPWEVERSGRRPLPAIQPDGNRRLSTETITSYCEPSQQGDSESTENHGVWHPKREFFAKRSSTFTLGQYPCFEVDDDTADP